MISAKLSIHSAEIDGKSNDESTATASGLALQCFTKHHTCIKFKKFAQP